MKYQYTDIGVVDRYLLRSADRRIMPTAYHDGAAFEFIANCTNSDTGPYIVNVDYLGDKVITNVDRERMIVEGEHALIWYRASTDDCILDLTRLTLEELYG